MNMELTVTAENGRSFRVRRLVNGSTYGRGAVWNSDKAGAEFFDMTGGTFTGGLYYVETLLSGADRPLFIASDIPAWHIDAQTMATVRGWLGGF